MFCNHCGEGFEDWLITRLIGGDRTSNLCKECYAAPFNIFSQVGNRYCTLCGDLLSKEEADRRLICDICRAGGSKLSRQEKKRRKDRARQSRDWQAKNKNKVKAQSKAYTHPLALVIVYECPCDHPKKHNHHFDYELPLMVVRLCPSCHSKEHVRLRAEAELGRKTI